MSWATLTPHKIEPDLTCNKYDVCTGIFVIIALSYWCQHFFGFGVNFVKRNYTSDQRNIGAKRRGTNPFALTAKGQICENTRSVQRITGGELSQSQL